LTPFIYPSTIENPDRQPDDYVIYVMLEKYDQIGNLLTQIPLEQKKGENTRVYVTLNGEIYIVYYEVVSNKGPVVTRWILKKEGG